MRKYGLKCPYRGPNPYRRMAKAIRTNAVFPNAVNREFVKGGVRKVLLTDITYIFYDSGVCYLSTILDAFTREILAYQLSKNLAVDFVLQTVDRLVTAHGSTLDDTTIIHSDQGCHYTSKAFIIKLSDNKFVQSMSRKGNCWDNAPQESFFGHMKDEIKYEIAFMKTFEEVQAKIDDWIDYYNNDRYQWELEKLKGLKDEIIKSITGESVYSKEILAPLVTEVDAKVRELEEQCSTAEKEIADSTALLKELNASYNEIISWSNLYDTASIESKKMIANAIIKRVDVYSGYRLNIELNVNIRQFLIGLDEKEPSLFFTA